MMVLLKGAIAVARSFVLDHWIARMPGVPLLPGHLNLVINTWGGFHTQKAYVQKLPETVRMMGASATAARPTRTSRRLTNSSLCRQLLWSHPQCAAESVASQLRQVPAAARVPPLMVPGVLPVLTA